MTYKTGHSLLDKDEELKLIKEVQAKGKNWQRAMDKLVKHNVDFIYFIAKKCKAIIWHADRADDIIQNGLIGFMTGIEKFDTSSGTRLSTYVGHYVYNEISRSIQKGEFNSAIVQPVHVYAITNKLKRIQKKHAVDINNCYQLYLDECEELGLSVQFTESAIKQAFTYMNYVILDGNKPLNDEEDDGTTLYDTIPSKSDSPGEIINKLQKVDVVRNLLSHLPLRDRDIVVRRFGIDCHEHTLQEIANVYGITREAIRLIIMKSLRKLENYKHIVK